MVAEELRFPELAKAFFESGPGRASASLGAALKQRRAAWRIAVDDCDRAAEQFLGMIRDDLHLRVVLGLRKPPGPQEAERPVAQAVALFVRGCRTAERPAGRGRNRSERQGVGSGKGVAVRVDDGGARYNKKKKNYN